MKTVYSGYFYDFALDETMNSLTFIWKPETKTLTDNDFKEALSNYGGYAFEYGVDSMIVDVRSFIPETGAPSAEVVGRWRSEVIVPRYNKAGIKKFAYLKTPDAPGPQVSEPVRHEGETFTTAVFDAETKMLAWLTS